MDHKTIELLLLQLEESFSKSRSNIYSDNKKESHFIELHELFHAIKSSNYKTLTGSDLDEHYNILSYIFKGLEYLDNSTLNIIPYEIVSCLEIALADWVKRDHFIIVTSLSNRNNDFYFESNDNDERFKNRNKYISGLYGLKITHRLIKIGLPKVLSRDYLSCVVLYHELGHFVDSELNISKKLLLKKYGTDKPQQNKTTFTYFRHKGEYFADLFAAQYINNASNLYLNYIASKDPDTLTHPATSRRISVVNKFLSGKKCVELDEFNNVLSFSGGELLKIRYQGLDLKKSQFPELIPQHIGKKEELHSIFKLGWDFWTNSDKNFLKDFKPRQKYHIINNLIEKSISNFTTMQTWKKLKN